MLITLSFGVLVIFTLYLLGLSGLCFFRKDVVHRFFQQFAQSFRAHLVEMCLRLVIGAAFLHISYQLYFSTPIVIFAYTLVGSSVFLLILPWRLHQRFASRVVPQVLLHARWFGVGALCLAFWMCIYILTLSTRIL